MITSYVDAEKLDLKFSTYPDWWNLAGQVQGYKLCEEIGVEWGAWWREQKAKHSESGKWENTTLELIAILFFQSRKTKFNGGFSEDFDIIDSILHEIATRTGQQYDTDLALRDKILSTWY
jgi:hypothetical protein